MAAWGKVLWAFDCRKLKFSPNNKMSTITYFLPIEGDIHDAVTSIKQHKSNFSHTHTQKNGVSLHSTSYVFYPEYS